MILKKLWLKDFRNIPEACINPDPVFNIFWGNNAQGKTNILEAIYLLGALKSFRLARSEEMIRKGSRQSLVKGETESGGVNQELQISLDYSGKKPLLNGKQVNQASKFFRCLRPILFAPEEVALIKGAPAGRRSLLDRAIFQTDPGYLTIAQDFDRILRQRNRLLKERCKPAELVPWTAALVRTGALIRHQRYMFLKRLVPLFRTSYQQICAGAEEADLLYPEGGVDIAGLEETLFRSTERSAETERQAGITLTGPHRDDPCFTINGLPVRQFASQGQQRSLLLAFKTAQIIDLEKITGEPPILLLDDLTGELDQNRQKYFFNFLLQREGQVFMTTTDPGPLQSEGFSQARTFEVKAGVLKSVHSC